MEVTKKWKSELNAIPFVPPGIKTGINVALTGFGVGVRSETFTSRGAGISFLPVCPGEHEALYKPLTYLRGGKSMLVAAVQPVPM